jgi:hypothetical protein
MRTIHLLAIALLAAVGACSGQSREWVRPGDTSGDLPLARDQCSSQSGSYDFAFEDRFTDRPGVIEDGPTPESRAGSALGYVYRDCMQDHGWQREPASRSQPPR